MTELLEKAIDMASKLPPTDQQALAAMWIQEMEDDQRWSKLIAQSTDVLGRIADEALEDFQAGRTDEMGWDKL